MRQQDSVMKYDPATGDKYPYPSHATQWRLWHGSSMAWLFNPWTGDRRSSSCVGSDPLGLLIIPPGEPVLAAPPETTRKRHETPPFRLKFPAKE